MVNKTVINKTCIVFYGRKHIVMSAWDWALFRGNGNSREKLMRFKLFLNSIVCGVRLILHKGDTMNKYTNQHILQILNADKDEKKLGQIISNIFRDGYRRGKADEKYR